MSLLIWFLTFIVIIPTLCFSFFKFMECVKKKKEDHKYRQTTKGDINLRNNKKLMQIKNKLDDYENSN